MGGLVNIVVFAISALLAAFSVFGLVPLAFLLFMTYFGAAGRVEKASQQLSTTLMDGEYIEAEAIQHRVFALWNRRATIGITASRILVVNRGLFGGFKMVDIQWKDLENATIEQNVLPNLCGSNLKFKHLNNGAGRIEVYGVESDIAAVIYSKSQSQEQAWEEKRRVRRIEEVRAAAGGVVVHNGPAANATPSLVGGNRMLEEITKAKALLDAGAVSDAEFQEMKAKILSAA